MLKELRVDNFVLIKSLQFKPESGLNIITGETGAGKSILIGALGLILGERADMKAVLESESKCIIEGVFDVTKLAIKPLFEKYDLDYSPETILRREILPSGKSRAFVNDTPVSLNVMKLIGEELVDIHSQHQTLHLGNQNFLFNWLDTVTNSTQLATSYSEAYTMYRQELSRLENLQETVSKQQAEQDYFQFLYNELEEIDLDYLTKTDIEAEHELLQNADEIGETLAQSIHSLEGDEESIVNKLNQILHQVQKLKAGDEFLGIVNRLKGVSIDLDEISTEISNFATNVQPDPQRLEEVNELMAKLHALQTKHRVSSIEELSTIKADLAEKLSLNVDNELELEKLQKSIQLHLESSTELAKELHESRKVTISNIEVKANNDLDYLGLPNAQLKLDLTTTSNLTLHGLSEFQLLFSSNKGSSLRPAHKVASGGELSRLMLIMKSYLAANKSLPTIIFDEIDTGVSGEIALKMGDMMHTLSSNMQVISITHLPQIASKGNAHFYVYKKVEDAQTNTYIKPLDPNERVEKIAQMLGGDIVTEAAMANARELLK